MSEGSTVFSRAVRRQTVFRVLGTVYLAYHGLAASWLVVEFFVNTRPGYWRESGVLAELVLTMLLYPLAIPALILCGGLHNCGGSPLTVLAVPMLLVTLVAAGSGCWLGLRFFRRRRRA
jgi:hypothetical protein